jgi:hypothetical protein
MWFHRDKTEDHSAAAVEESIETLKKTEQRSDEVTEVSQALRTLREVNHFAEQLESIMGGPR